MRHRNLISTAGIALIAVLLAFSAGCTVEDLTNVDNATPTPTAGPGGVLRIATTTSLDATGLLAEIEETYEGMTGVDMQIIAQGTGQSLETARRCDVDLVLVHAPSLEEQFIADGFGINHRCFAYNYFIIVGPENDPAGINGTEPVEAFQAIFEAGENGTPGVAFVSRGDNSGTHTAERLLWEAAGYNYATDIQGSNWYFETGQGMGETLVQANERNGYTLSDEGTYLSFQRNLDLVTLVGQGPELLNRYSVMAVNPEQCPDANVEAANGFINWLISDEGKQLVGEFGQAEFNQSLFTPLYEPECQQFNCTCSGSVS
ncbi:MAG: substrate-binding domain-containing protein [Methanomicrobiales archaeon]|nr:substrate-binding domain-containing protein [Methanomicrobiales archaeon]